LDIQEVSEEGDFCVARILIEDDLDFYFGTPKPTRKTVEENFDDIFDDIDRGEAVCITVYENEEPSELLFIGYSFD